MNGYVIAATSRLLLLLLSVIASATGAQSRNLLNAAGVIPGTNAIFDSIHDHPSTRGHHAFVLFNSVAKEIPCRICKPMDDTFTLLAESVSVEEKRARRVAFVRMDLKSTRNSFVKMRVDQVPLLFHFAPTGEPQKYDLRDGVEFDDIVRFVESRSGVKVVVHRKIDYKLIVQTVVIGVLLGGIGFRFRQELLRCFLSRVVRGAAVVLFTTAMTSGVMWNRIRKPAPYGIREASRGGATAIDYISSSLQQQYGMESQITFGLALWCSLSLLLVPLATPTIKSSSVKRGAVLLLMLSFLLSLSLTLRVFRLKLPSYPFKLLL